MNILLRSFWGVILVVSAAQAQQITITGKIKEITTGEGIPFAHVYLKNKRQSVATMSDEQGNYRLQFAWEADSLQVSCVGFVSQSRAFGKAAKQEINFSLQEERQMLQAVEIRAGENPAFAIVRQAARQKYKLDARRLPACSYESYNRLEGYILPQDKGLNRLKALQEMQALAEQMPALRNAQGQSLVPVLLSESLSEVWHRQQAPHYQEQAKGSRLSGIGLEYLQGLEQFLLGARHNDYDLLRNQVSFFGKYFASPIADGWALLYDYDLLDSLYVGGDWCYELRVLARHESDLVFQGKIWIAQEDYALRKADLWVSEKANLNFISGIRLYQEYEKLPITGYWLLKTSLFEADMTGLSDLLPHVSIKQKMMTQAGQAYLEAPASSIQKEATEAPLENIAWEAFAQDSTLFAKVDMFAFVDSLRKVPSVKSLSRWSAVLASGYIELANSPIDIGHLLRSYAWNDVEGHRIGWGFRTNKRFSERWQLKFRGAYGTGDEAFKYRAEASYLLSKKRFTLLGLSRTDEIEPLIQLNQGEELLDLFTFSNRLFRLSERRPFHKIENTFWIESELQDNILQRVSLQNRQLEALFPFVYFGQEADGSLLSDIKTCEVVFQTTFLHAGRKRRDKNRQLQRVGGGFSKPQLSLTGVLGMRGLLEGQFNYQKAFASLSQRNARILA